ncbi:hypothetical protein F4778DRAFT_768075 [Xylariomycetidae sp. FL2044]|nr:hypothetical protein F4778DRAFT_768075 [Xylariomycetidae sp. FL2044]
MNNADTSPPSPVSARPLDDIISRMLSERPNPSSSNYNSKRREDEERCRLRNIDQTLTVGDTVVVVRFPRGFVDCDNFEWTTKEFVMESEKLLATGSSVLRTLLSPQKQQRTLRRLGRCLDQIAPRKYLIDLTPSGEGDEAAAQLMELSLPTSVRDWWIAQERVGCSQYLVSGHDDHCPQHHQVPIDCEIVPGCHRPPKDRSIKMFSLEVLDLSHIIPSKPRMIPDYCAVRHRVNILRLLLAIQGHDIVLNSAPRVYTLTAIAKMLECTGAIRDAVYTWVMADPNTDFIDFNPEVSLRIAWPLELADMARAAFRVLVVERTMTSLHERGKPGARKTLLGRPRDNLPDEIETVVEHAVFKLSERVQEELKRLTADDLLNWLQVEEWTRLQGLEQLLSDNTVDIASATLDQSYAMNEVDEAFKALKNELRVLAADTVRGLRMPLTLEQINQVDRIRRFYVPRGDLEPFVEIHRTLSLPQCMLFTSCWENMATMAQDHTRTVMMRKLADTLNTALALAHYRECYPQLRQFSSDVGELTIDQILCHDVSRFNADRFHSQFATAIEHQAFKWRRVANQLDSLLSKSRHMVLELEDNEFQYLPLWAGGLEDGTYGIYQAVIPDSDMGPVGPGPSFKTGNTIMTTVSSIGQSAPTATCLETVTMTAGRSVAAAHSDAGETIATRDPALSMSAWDDLGDSDMEPFEDVSGDENDEAWSMVSDK